MRTLSGLRAPAAHGGQGRETWASCIARMVFERAAGGDLRAAALILDRIDGRVAALLSDEDEVVEIERIAPRLTGAHNTETE